MNEYSLVWDIIVSTKLYDNPSKVFGPELDRLAIIFITQATVLAWLKPKISRVWLASLSTTLYCIWLFLSQLRLFTTPCPCKELNEQASASQSLSCRLCLMMSWITNSAQRWRFQGGAVTHYGREKKNPASLSDRFWVSQIVHKFGTRSHKCQETEENRQTNSSSVMAALMITSERGRTK